jgi:hypothetical protein
MIYFGDVGNVSKIDKVKKVKKFGVQAYVVLIQLCTALALASDHPQIYQTHLWKATFMF